MKTFCLETLGCKVNHYESEQVAALLRARGMVQTAPALADLRIINSCSVTVQAARQSRQAARRMVRLTVLSDRAAPIESASVASVADAAEPAASAPVENSASRPRVLVMGCWATSDPAQAAAIAGVDAVLTHRHDLAAEIDRLLVQWRSAPAADQAFPAPRDITALAPSRDTAEIHQEVEHARSGAGENIENNRPDPPTNVKDHSEPMQSPARQRAVGANSLPLLRGAQEGRRRAFLKIQDGCDAHCTYCIIPQLRPALFSKPVEQTVEEARRLVDAGHVELVLTGIFLGAYGHSTALRRRQSAEASPLAQLIDALCRRVPGLKRLRLSSLEPGDLSHDLLSVLASHEQVTPHFHLPLQSGSDELLRRMNRQYRRDDFLRTVDRLIAAFDRPALTTDVIVGFPGEDDREFEQTVRIVQRCGFIHVHAFAYSPRPKTAAARWTKEFVHGSTSRQRIDRLSQIADENSLRFRRTFVGQVARIIVEKEKQAFPDMRHGRCERYFPVCFNAGEAEPGELASIRILQATPRMTLGQVEPRG